MDFAGLVEVLGLAASTVADEFAVQLVGEAVAVLAMTAVKAALVLEQECLASEMTLTLYGTAFAEDSGMATESHLVPDLGPRVLKELEQGVAHWDWHSTPCWDPRVVTWAVDAALAHVLVFLSAAVSGHNWHGAGQAPVQMTSIEGDLVVHVGSLVSSWMDSQAAGWCRRPRRAHCQCFVQRLKDMGWHGGGLAQG